MGRLRLNHRRLRTVGLGGVGVFLVQKVSEGKPGPHPGAEPPGAGACLARSLGRVAPISQSQLQYGFDREVPFHHVVHGQAKGDPRDNKDAAAQPR